jgi:N-acetylglutamate synthase/N-acetylornithine aminotransferase
LKLLVDNSYFGCLVAGAFTENVVAAAPVLYCRKVLSASSVVSKADFTCKVLDVCFCA